MPKKPQAMRAYNKGKLVPNRIGMAGRGLRKYGNPELIQFALDMMLADVESGLPQAGRYTRVKVALFERFNCNKRHAEEAIAGARAYNADVFADERALRVPEVCAQLQRIADKSETLDPKASIAALKEINSVLGAHQPLKVDITHGVAPELQLQSIIGVLDAAGRAALDVVLAQIDAAKASGRLQLEDGDADVEDAEILDVTGN